MLKEYLNQIGLTDKEITLYLALTEVGVQPASVLARRCNLDRVSTYKHLKKMADRGFLNVYVRDGVQCFGVAGSDGFKSAITERIASSQKLLKQTAEVESILRSLTRGDAVLPNIEIFEGETGIKRLFRDMLFEVKTQKLRQIRMMTSNTFAQKLGNVPLSRFMGEFFREVRDAGLSMDITEASGTSIPERVHTLTREELRLEELPAARGTVNMFLVGSAVYIACYTDTQIGLKIKQDEMSQMFHFFLDMLRKQAE